MVRKGNVYEHLIKKWCQSLNCISIKGFCKYIYRLLGYTNVYVLFCAEDDLCNLPKRFYTNYYAASPNSITLDMYNMYTFYVCASSCAKKKILACGYMGGGALTVLYAIYPTGLLDWPDLYSYCKRWQSLTSSWNQVFLGDEQGGPVDLLESPYSY